VGYSFVSVPLHYALDPSEMYQILSTTGTRAVVCEGALQLELLSACFQHHHQLSEKDTNEAQLNVQFIVLMEDIELPQGDEMWDSLIRAGLKILTVKQVAKVGAETRRDNVPTLADEASTISFTSGSTGRQWIKSLPAYISNCIINQDVLKEL